MGVVILQSMTVMRQVDSIQVCGVRQMDCDSIQVYGVRQRDCVTVYRYMV